MPDDDWALGQNMVDVRNEARREYQLQRTINPFGNPVIREKFRDELDDLQQTAICTNDEHCRAGADEHHHDCPVERQLQDEFGGF